MPTIHIDKMSKQQIVSEMMRMSSDSTAALLYGIYYRFITDQLDADYLEDLGYRFGIDLEAEFVKQMARSQEEDEEEN